MEILNPGMAICANIQLPQTSTTVTPQRLGFLMEPKGP